MQHTLHLFFLVCCISSLFAQELFESDFQFTTPNIELQAGDPLIFFPDACGHPTPLTANITVFSVPQSKKLQLECSPSLEISAVTFAISFVSPSAPDDRFRQHSMCPGIIAATGPMRPNSGQGGWSVDPATAIHSSEFASPTDQISRAVPGLYLFCLRVHPHHSVFHFASFIMVVGVTSLEILPDCGAGNVPRKEEEAWTFIVLPGCRLTVTARGLIPVTSSAFFTLVDVSQTTASIINAQDARCVPASHPTIARQTNEISEGFCAELQWTYILPQDILCGLYEITIIVQNRKIIAEERVRVLNLTEVRFLRLGDLSVFSNSSDSVGGIILRGSTTLGKSDWETRPHAWCNNEIQQRSFSFEFVFRCESPTLDAIGSCGETQHSSVVFAGVFLHSQNSVFVPITNALRSGRYWVRVFLGASQQRNFRAAWKVLVPGFTTVPPVCEACLVHVPFHFHVCFITDNDAALDVPLAHHFSVWIQCGTQVTSMFSIASLDFFDTHVTSTSEDRAVLCVEISFLIPITSYPSNCTIKPVSMGLVDSKRRGIFTFCSNTLSPSTPVLGMRTIIAKSHSSFAFYLPKVPGYDVRCGGCVDFASHKDILSCSGITEKSYVLFPGRRLQCSVIVSPSVLDAKSTLLRPYVLPWVDVVGVLDKLASVCWVPQRLSSNPTENIEVTGLPTVSLRLEGIERSFFGEVYWCSREMCLAVALCNESTPLTAEANLKFVPPVGLLCIELPISLLVQAEAQQLFRSIRLISTGGDALDLLFSFKGPDRVVDSTIFCLNNVHATYAGTTEALSIEVLMGSDIEISFSSCNIFLLQYPAAFGIREEHDESVSLVSSAQLNCSMISSSCKIQFRLGHYSIQGTQREEEQVTLSLCVRSMCLTTTSNAPLLKIRLLPLSVSTREKNCIVVRDYASLVRIFDQFLFVFRLREVTKKNVHNLPSDDTELPLAMQTERIVAQSLQEADKHHWRRIGEQYFLCRQTELLGEAKGRLRVGLEVFLNASSSSESVPIAYFPFPQDERQKVVLSVARAISSAHILQPIETQVSANFRLEFIQVPVFKRGVSVFWTLWPAYTSPKVLAFEPVLRPDVVRPSSSFSGPIVLRAGDVVGACIVQGCAADVSRERSMSEHSRNDFDLACESPSAQIVHMMVGVPAPKLRRVSRITLTFQLIGTENFGFDPHPPFWAQNSTDCHTQTAQQKTAGVIYQISNSSGESYVKLARKQLPSLRQLTTVPSLCLLIVPKLRITEHPEAFPIALSVTLSHVVPPSVELTVVSRRHEVYVISPLLSGSLKSFTRVSLFVTYLGSRSYASVHRQITHQSGSLCPKEFAASVADQIAIRPLAEEIQRELFRTLRNPPRSWGVSSLRAEPRWAVAFLQSGLHALCLSDDAGRTSEFTRVLAVPGPLHTSRVLLPHFLKRIQSHISGASHQPHPGVELALCGRANFSFPITEGTIGDDLAAGLYFSAIRMAHGGVDEQLMMTDPCAPVPSTSSQHLRLSPLLPRYDEFNDGSGATHRTASLVVESLGLSGVYLVCWIKPNSTQHQPPINEEEVEEHVLSRFQLLAPSNPSLIRRNGLLVMTERSSIVLPLVIVVQSIAAVPPRAIKTTLKTAFDEKDQRTQRWELELSGVKTKELCGVQYAYLQCEQSKRLIAKALSFRIVSASQIHFLFLANDVPIHSSEFSLVVGRENVPTNRWSEPPELMRLAYHFQFVDKSA